MDRRHRPGPPAGRRTRLISGAGQGGDGIAPYVAHCRHSPTVASALRCVTTDVTERSDDDRFDTGSRCFHCLRGRLLPRGCGSRRRDQHPHTTTRFHFEKAGSTLRHPNGSIGRPLGNPVRQPLVPFRRRPASIGPSGSRIVTTHQPRATVSLEMPQRFAVSTRACGRSPRAGGGCPLAAAARGREGTMARSLGR